MVCGRGLKDGWNNSARFPNVRYLLILKAVIVW